MELLNHTIVLYELGNSVISDEAPAELKKMAPYQASNLPKPSGSLALSGFMGLFGLAGYCRETAFGPGAFTRLTQTVRMLQGYPFS